MNAAKQAIWVFFTLITLAGSGWYFVSKPAPASKLDAKTLSQTADVIVTHLTVRQFNSEGQLVNYLKTPELKHIPENDSNFLSSPYIVVKQNQDEPAWEIRAKEANSINKGKEVIFRKEVVIHQNKGKTTQESTMRTEELTYFPKEQFATSNQLVHFEQPGSRVDSQGMRAYLNDKRVILSKAHATYDPRHS